ncbi:PIG-L family deacetylase [Embleya sp. NPDC008237]|uniref:PIG-L family deacetylase n=1 Tax=Embleya sp. NPDC008237 TaxID=3363978 RepID=UPI0036E5E72D
MTPPLDGNARPIGRRVILAGAGVVAVAAPLAWWQPWERGDDPGGAPTGKDAPLAPAPRSDSAIRTLQIVAHPDDDFYFMNPDIVNSVRAGAALTTVYLTGGEGDGRNVGNTDPALSRAKADFARYSAARQNGARAAYARMALGDRTARWTRRSLQTPGGLAEISTLDGAPHVQLVFLGLREARTKTQFRKDSLRSLWEQSTDRLGTIPVTGGPLTHAYSYTRTTLSDSLLQLMQAFRPTLVRTLDPDPESDPANGEWVSEDHQDHTASALFALDALRRYQESGPAAPVLVDCYRAYSNGKWPHNLGAKEFADKRSFLETYGWVDRWNCGDPAGCGDVKVGVKPIQYGWAESTYRRFPPNTSWLQADAGGRMCAFAVVNGQATMWVEDKAGEAWRKPVSLGGDRLGPYLEVLRLPNGQLRLFGIRMTLAPTPQAQVREIVTTSQSAGGAFGSWESIGAPNPNAIGARESGVPTAVADGTGQVHVFARNQGRGLSTRVLSSKGVWGEWIDLGGADLQDGVSPVLTRENRVEVYGANTKAVLRWSQDRAGGPLGRPEPLPCPAPAGPPTIVAQADGRQFLLVRQPDTAEVLLYRRTGSKNEWNTDQPVNLGTPGGYGRVGAVVGPDGAIVLGVLNDKSGASVTRLGADPSGAGTPTWTELPGAIGRLPALAVDGTGRAVVATMSQDGALSVHRQQQAAFRFTAIPR